MSEDSKAYSVSQYSRSIDRLLKSKVPAIWVQGVITQLQVRGQVAYLTLTEYAEGSEKPVANLSLFCWAKDFEVLRHKARSFEAPFEIELELKVSLLIEAEFYVPFGKFQPKVIDIDPRFTQGEMVITRETILKKLQASGLINKNKQLAWKIPSLNIGLITAPESAAYHDFSNALLTSPWNFHIELKPAVMQGDRCAQSIVRAIQELNQSNVDVIVLTRGGGSKTDLVYFDSEEMCSAIAKSSKPVVSGIGHQIDNSLTDVVAWATRMTPTDCAKLIIDQVQNHWDDLNQLRVKLSDISKKELMENSVFLESCQFDLQLKAKSLLQYQSQSIINIAKTMKIQSRNLFHKEKSRYGRNETGLVRGTHKLLVQNEILLKSFKDQLRQLSSSKLHLQSESLKLKSKWISAISPQRTIERGYTLTRKKADNNFLNFSPGKVGDIILTETKDLLIESKIESINKK